MDITQGVLLLMVALTSRSFAQVLNPMCSWSSPRAASIQGGLYANGGLWVGEGDASSSGIQGLTYFLNYSKPFNTTDNTDFSAFFAQAKTAGLTTNYVDGTMFADEDEYYLYGYVQYV